MTRSPNLPITRFEMDYGGRQQRLAHTLLERRLDGLLVTHLANVRYLCGFTGSAGVLLLADGRSTFFTDGRYRQQARDEVRHARVVLPKGPVLDAAARAAAQSSLRTIGIEGEHVTLAAAKKIRVLLGPKTRLHQTLGLVEHQRMVKEPAELQRIRAAVRLAASLFDRTLGAIRPGVSEAAVAAELEYAARNAGAEGMSFETIVAAGARSALPHGRASTALIPRTGFVVLDFGVILAGYCSDMTRTVYLGKPTREARRVYDAVREGQQAAVEAVRPGKSVGEVDHAARSKLRRAGLARHFTHSTGHGVGLEIHEPPRVAAGQEDVLRPGMVITVEPGVYIPGFGGVRIEDMVVVTAGGYEVLTPTSRELFAL